MAASAPGLAAFDPSRIDLRDPLVKANPYPLYARFRAEAPVCRFKGIGRHFWLITRYEDVVTVLKDPRFSTDRRNIDAGPPVTRLERTIGRVYGALLWNMLNRDEPEHGRLRSFVHKAFSAHAVQQLRDRVGIIASGLLDRVASRPHWDLVEDFATPLPVMVISEMLGVPPADRQKFRHWSTEVTIAFGSGIPGILLNSPAMFAFQRYIKWLIENRRRQPGDDLVSTLVHAESEEGGKLNDFDLLAMILLLLIAGQETTVNLIASGVLALLEHPEQTARLRSNPHLMPSAVEEFARYYTPVDYANARWTRTEVELSGVPIPAGELLTPAIGSANRDESVFPDPDRLDIAREPNRHVGFGQGMHYCLGVFLARLETQIAIAVLLDRFSSIRLDTPRPMLRWRPSFLLRGLEALPIETR